MVSVGDLFTFQPSELAKPVLVLFLAYFLQTRIHQMDDVKGTILRAVAVPGSHATHRWVRFGDLFTFQPSELAKPVLVMFLAYFLQTRIHLILGGKDKDSDYSTMADMLKKRVKIVYTVGSAAEKIERQLHGVVKMVSAQTIEAAVAKAAKAAAPGDVVLLSPACSSFDQFENYEHRGRVFRQSVMELD